MAPLVQLLPLVVTGKVVLAIGRLLWAVVTIALTSLQWTTAGKKAQRLVAGISSFFGNKLAAFAAGIPRWVLHILCIFLVAAVGTVIDRAWHSGSPRTDQDTRVHPCGGCKAATSWTYNSLYELVDLTSDNLSELGALDGSISTKKDGFVQAAEEAMDTRSEMIQPYIVLRDETIPTWIGAQLYGQDVATAARSDAVDGGFDNLWGRAEKCRQSMDSYNTSSAELLDVTVHARNATDQELETEVEVKMPSERHRGLLNIRDRLDATKSAVVKHRSMMYKDECMDKVLGTMHRDITHVRDRLHDSTAEESRDLLQKFECVRRTWAYQTSCTSEGSAEGVWM